MNQFPDAPHSPTEIPADEYENDFDKLAEAIFLIEEVLERLNKREAKCSKCGLTKHENQDDWKAHNELTGAKNKLEKWLPYFKGQTVENTNP